MRTNFSDSAIPSLKRLFRSPIFWLGDAVAWTVFGSLMALEIHSRYTRLGVSMSWNEAITGELLYAWIWALATPLVLYLAVRFPLRSGLLTRHFPILAAACVLTAAVQKFVYGVLFALQTKALSPAFSSSITGLWDHIDYGITLFWLLVVIVHSVDYYRRYRDHEIRAAHLSSQLAKAQVEALRMQIKPHFLFNTLNAISVLTESDPARARKMISRLSDLLRHTLDSGTDQLVPLSKELELLSGYLEIEEIRFADRLQVNIDAAPDSLNAMVPSLLLQPLVENALRHGVANNRGCTRVSVTARVEGANLTVSVTDDGPGLGAAAPLREGIGLSNTRARLAAIYGEGAYLKLESPKYGGFIACITIPLSGNGV